MRTFIRDEHWSETCSHEFSWTRFHAMSWTTKERQSHFSVVEQCRYCGEKGASTRVAELKKRFDPSALPEFNYKLRDRISAEKRAAVLASIPPPEDRRQSYYEIYLKSDEWRAKREKVLQRSRGRCEGCDDRAATQVHHLTYRRLGRELLFDLVALCGECHGTVHDERRNLA